MADEVKVKLSADEDVTDALEKVAQSATRTERVIVQSMGSTEQAFDTAARSSGKLGEGLDLVSGAASQLSGGIDDAASGILALRDAQNADREKARELARAVNDVDQAQQDMRQSVRDASQAIRDQSQSVIDAEQADINYATAIDEQRSAELEIADAQKEYNDAVKAHGKNSREATEASIALSEAQRALKQGQLDAKQATEEKAQAEEDGKQSTEDYTQAQIDGKGAVLDLDEAQQNAKPPTNLEEWASKAQTIAPIITGAAGAADLFALANAGLSSSLVTSTAAHVGHGIAVAASATASGIATAAQWAWNIAVSAFPAIAIVLLIALVVGGIIWLATQTQFFQTIWEYVWNFLKEIAKWFAGPFVDFFKNAGNAIGNAFSGAWNWIKDTASNAASFLMGIPGRIVNAFASIAWTLSAPFRAAFNFVSDAWNNTIGRLSWSVPGWVPGIGGNNISAPRLAHFHTGTGSGTVPGAPGQEMLAVLKAGERVLQPGESGQADGVTNVHVTIELKAETSDELTRALLNAISVIVRTSGGSIDELLATSTVV